MLRAGMEANVKYPRVRSTNRAEAVKEVRIPQSIQHWPYASLSIAQKTITVCVGAPHGRRVSCTEQLILLSCVDSGQLTLQV